MKVQVKTRLSAWVIEKISGNIQIKSALMHLHSKSERTILRWLEQNNHMLRTNDSLSVIAAYLRIEPEQLVEPDDTDFDLADAPLFQCSAQTH